MSKQIEALSSLIESMGGEDSNQWQDLPADELWALAWKASIEQNIPDGWKLVPIKPTDAMLSDGLEVPWLDAEEHQIEGVWENMLAAAGNPPERAK